VESIAVTPSAYVTVHVRAPQVVIPKVLVTSESAQLRTLAAFLMSYVKAGIANFIVLIVTMSLKHGLVTRILKV
jgi:hypothetical protein